MADVRTEATAVLVLDEFLRTIQQINSDSDPTLWLTHPLTVDAGVVVADMNLPRPAVLVTLAFTPDDPLMTTAPRRHRMGIEIHVLILTDLADGGREPIRIASDIMKAVADNERLSGLVPGMVRFMSGDYDLDAMERTGFAAFRMRFAAAYSWTHDAP